MTTDKDAPAAPALAYSIGDIVETTKGAKFWGKIVALDVDPNNPGCTVMADDPGFKGVKHVYPFKQLRHRHPASLPDQPDAARAVADAIERFDAAARSWGWTSDQGYDRAKIEASEREYQDAKAALFAALVTEPSPAQADERVVEALRLAREHIVTLGGNPHPHDMSADQIQIAVLIVIDAALSTKENGQ